MILVPEPTDEGLAFVSQAFEVPVDRLVQGVLIAAYRLGAITAEDFEIYFLEHQKADTQEALEVVHRRWTAKVFQRLLAMDTDAPSGGRGGRF